MITRRLLLFAGLMTLPFFLYSQAPKFHAGLKIEAISDGNGFKFRLVNPPTLVPKTKNQPYLSYFWDFGDGLFKRGNFPEHTHIYAKSGKYQARVLVFTGNSDDMVEQPLSISVNATRAGTPTEKVEQTANLAITGSHYRDELRPSEDLIMAIGMKGQGSPTGKLYVFFNEKKHRGAKPLEYRRASDYFGEKEGADNLRLPDIAEAKSLFNDFKVFDVSKTDPSVSNLFLSFKQVANIKNKIVGEKVRTHAVWVANGRIEKANLTLNVVPSHDPNDMRVSPSYLSFRGIAQQEFTYKVRFENVSEGTANAVGIKISKPTQSDTSRIEWGDFSPKCEECPKDKPLSEIPYRCYRRVNTAEYAEFYFHNAQVAGRVKGMLDKDLNEGFVTYKLYPIRKGIKKKALASKAIVTFDGQEKPTNTAKVNFTRGMWWGAKFGVNYDPLSKQSNFFVGVTLSPYREVRPYLQFEAMMDVNKLVRQEFYTGDSTRTRLDNTRCEDCYVDTLSRVTANVRQSAINFVPLQVRWDLSKVLSIGAGTSMDIFFRNVESTSQIITRKSINGTCSDDKTYGDPVRARNQETTFKFAVFGDVQFGFDRLKLGARYIYPLDRVRGIDNVQLFVACKF